MLNRIMDPEFAVPMLILAAIAVALIFRVPTLRQNVVGS